MIKRPFRYIEEVNKKGSLDDKEMYRKQKNSGCRDEMHRNDTVGYSSFLFIYPIGCESMEVSDVFKFQLSTFHGASSINFTDATGMEV